MLTLCISGNTIRAVSGSYRKKHIILNDIYEYTDTTGCIQNGMINDEEAYSNILESFFSEHSLPRKDVVLVLDSSQFVTKLIDTPIMNKKNTELFMKNEFSSVERMNSPVISYECLYEDKANKKSTSFAACAERSLIEMHIRAFNHVGITITSVRTAMGSTLMLLKENEQLKAENCILQIFDGTELVNVLFIDKKYKYSSKTRIIGKKGTTAFAAEVSRAVSNILQFVKASSPDSVIGGVVMNNVSEVDFEFCKDAIGIVSTSLSVEKFDIEKSITYPTQLSDRIERFLVCASAVIPMNRDTDLYTRTKTDEKGKQMLREALQYAKPVIGCFALFLLVTSGLIGYRMILRSKLNDIYAYTEDPSIVAQCDEYDALEDEITLMQSYLNGVMAIKSDNETFPHPGNIAKAVLNRCAGDLASVKITAYDSVKGILKFDCTASDVELINQFIKLIKLENSFYNVTYTGYIYQEKDEVWIVNVVCYLSETAGKTEAN